MEKLIGKSRLNALDWWNIKLSDKTKQSLVDEHYPSKLVYMVNGFDIEEIHKTQLKK